MSEMSYWALGRVALECDDAVRVVPDLDDIKEDAGCVLYIESADGNYHWVRVDPTWKVSPIHAIDSAIRQLRKMAEDHGGAISRNDDDISSKSTH